VRRPALLVLPLLLSACASWPGWPARGPVLPPPSAYPDADAVILRAHTAWGLQYDRRRRMSGSSWYTYSESRLILTEAGVQGAVQRVPVWRHAHLDYLHARTVQPDGRAIEVDPAAILVEEHRAAGSDANEEVYIVRFPEVRVGSVVEVALSIEREGLTLYRHERVTGKDPIAHCEFELTASPELGVSLKVYNAYGRVSRDDLGYAQRLRFSLDDVPALGREELRPHWTSTDPWWGFRLTQAPQGFQLAADWSGATEQIARRLYDLADARTLKLPHPPEDCDGPCRVRWAVQATHALTEWVGDAETFAPRPIDKIVDSGLASDDEKALVLYHLLRVADLESQFAFVPPGINGPDREFPMPSLLHHAVVLVPAQRGLPGATWIDPGCESCAPGVLPEELLGASAVLVKRSGWAVFTGAAQASFVTIAGSPAAPSSVHRHYQVTVDAAGDADVVMTEDRTGRLLASARSAARARTAAEWEREATREVGARAPTGQLVAQSPASLERATGRGHWEIRFRVPGYATVNDARLVLPLTLLRSSLDGLFVEQRRRRPIFIASDDQVEETMRVRVPPALRLATAPPRYQAASPRIQSEFKVVEEDDGVSVTRSITRRRGQSPPEAYPAIRQAVRGFAGGRDEVLVFERRR